MLLKEQKIRQILKQTFLYDDFKPNQLDPIMELVKDRPKDILCIYPTSAGKSLIYQLPGVFKKQITIVICPLIALMQDQIMKLRQLSLAAFSYSSDDTLNSKFELSQISQQNQEIDFIYTTPESFSDNQFKQIISNLRQRIGLVAVDECHVIIEWGKSFRRAYRNLGNIRDTLPDVPIIALTASATFQSAQEIALSLKLQQPIVFVQSFNRPNIHYMVWHMVENKSKEQMLLDVVQTFKKQEAQRSIIVYTATRIQAEQIEDLLTRNGSDAQFYHAGLSNDNKLVLLQQWQKDEVQIIIATIAFAMGIDKSSVGLVIHYSLPKSMEGFYQESGRAGRDGKSSYSLVLVDPSDVNFRTQNVTKEDIYDQYSYYSLLFMLYEQQCRRQHILKYFKSGLATKKQSGACCDCCSGNSIFSSLIQQQALEQNGICKGIENQLTFLKQQVKRGDLCQLFKETPQCEAQKTEQTKSDKNTDDIKQQCVKKLIGSCQKKMDGVVIPDFDIGLVKVVDYASTKAGDEVQLLQCIDSVASFILRQKRAFSLKQLEGEVYKWFIGK